jgi:hypothetical protein
VTDFPKFKAEELNGDIQQIEPGYDPDLHEAQRVAQIKDIRVRSWIKIVALVVFTAIGAGIVFTYVWHLVVPESWRWLTAEEVDAIKDLALSIATGVSLSLATKYTIK